MEISKVKREKNADVDAKRTDFAILPAEPALFSHLEKQRAGSFIVSTDHINKQ